MAGSLQRAWYHVAKWTVRGAFTFGMSLKTEGQHHVPAKGPFLLLANHASYLDPPAVGCGLSRPIFYLARATLWKNPTFGALLTSVNTLPVNQDGPAHEGLKAIIAKLQQGQGVVVFPEGTRTETGEMAPLQPGILLILRKVGFPFPIVPVGVGGTFATWPLHHKLPYLSPLFGPPASRGSIAVSYGPAVDSSAYEGMDRQAILGDLYERIHAQWRRAEAIRRQPR